MNATEAIQRITDLLGLKFKSETFATTKLVDGITEITNNKDSDLAVGDTLFVVGESTLTPAPAGEHITREGLKLEVDMESTITSIEMESDEGMEVKEDETEIENEKEDMMSSGTLADGTKIETDESGDFAVGQQLYFITSEGDKVKAPEGEHTTESGITIVTDAEGIITGVKYPNEAGEGSLEDYKKEMDKMKEAMSSMLTLMSEMNGKFKTEIGALKNEVENFKKAPDREPVLKKFASNTNEILEWKLELLKSSTRK